MRRQAKACATICVVLAAVGGGGWAAWRARATGGGAALPSAPARAGDFLVLVRCRGELKATRSRQINAPTNVPELRIVWQAPAGSMVKAGDPVVRFDPSSAQRQEKEQVAALNQAQAALDQAVAQSKVTAEQDNIDLSGTHYDVERARIDMRISEIKSKLEAETSEVNLGLAERKKSVQAAKVDLDKTSDEAKIASLTRQRDKAKEELDLTRERLKQLEVRTPIGGLVQYLQNFSQGWLNRKPFKVGDLVWPGAAIAEIPDLDSLEMEGKIEEIDRGRVALDMEVRAKVDALPEVAFPGRLTELSPMTVMSNDWPPVRVFSGSARIEHPDPRLRPGMNGQLDIATQRIANAISIPAKALFTRAGRPIVYIPAGRGYRAVEVEVLARNPDEVAIKGLAAGTQVTLVEPPLAGRKGPS